MRCVEAYMGLRLCRQFHAPPTPVSRSKQSTAKPCSRRFLTATRPLAPAPITQTVSPRSLTGRSPCQISAPPVHSVDFQAELIHEPLSSFHAAADRPPPGAGSGAAPEPPGRPTSPPVLMLSTVVSPKRRRPRLRHLG